VDTGTRGLDRRCGFLRFAARGPRVRLGHGGGFCPRRRVASKRR
jgi:hypothetical protein